MMRQELEQPTLRQPTETERPRMLNVVNLDYGTYEGLRPGNVIATSRGFVVKYYDVNDNEVFTGFLGATRKLEEFMVVNPQISGGVLDLSDSDIVRYSKAKMDKETKLIEVLELAGIRP